MRKRATLHASHTPPMTHTAPTEPAHPGKARDYKSTLNLPRTSFPMKASLVQNEPSSLKRWAAADLHARIRAARAGSPAFVFHDGPPYANGDIHLGHLLNKTLKDMVVRVQNMEGRDCLYVPGWDCHGLPIEAKVVTDLVTSKKMDKIAALAPDARRMAVRRECQKYAEKYVKLQAGQMQRLLTLADYEHPYLTMLPAFEGATLELFAILVEQGLIFRQRKPVHWSIANQTALAEAELEYEDREDPSVYVDFEAADPDAVYDAFGLPPAPAEDSEEQDASGHEFPGGRPTVRPSFMIWTTTPWTLPANLAIAVNPAFEYALVRMDGAVTVLAKDLVEKVAKIGKCEEAKILATTTGSKLVGLTYRHPFVDGAALAASIDAEPDALHRIVSAEYVTLEDGTGLVHTAPGHGVEDYQTGLRERIPIYCPVREDGTYDATAPDWLQGMSVWDANTSVTGHLRNSGHLFHHHMFTHSYPHDWRSKTPVIFRATEQWFIGVDRPTKREDKSLRRLGLDFASKDIGFVPEWGRNRLRGMLESRPDWCISRQRAWGLPIPAFFQRESDGSITTLLTPSSVRAVAKTVREKGSDVWFQASPTDILAHYNLASDPDAPKNIDLSRLEKASDIFDVWFESGSSWWSVMVERDIGFPVDLYLEGSDQHRGWFQSSLLCGLGAKGRPPYRTLLTHGFIVDRDGRKMSKSLGNTLNVEDLLKEFGADVCRWWVASLAYESDIKADLEFFKTAGEAYRKVRNTLRFMLSNLADLPANDAGGSPAPTSIDAWALSEFDHLHERVRRAYGEYDFREASQAIYDFCNDTLSSVYLAVVKDRLYCDRPDSPRRRQSQRALRTITQGLCKLLAPVLPHTADEAYRALLGIAKQDDRPETSVHLETFGQPTGVRADKAWPRALDARDAGLLALEAERKREGGVENPLDAGVTLPDPDRALSTFDARDLADLLGVSRVNVDASTSSATVTDLRAEPRCERSWKRDGTVKERSDGGMLSDRDAEAVGVK
ncbi:MAG: isoleucine--tRNA ligase [Phycisphaerales bacterium]